MIQFFPSDSQSIGASTLAISLSNEYSGLISFRIDCFDLLAVQESLKSRIKGLIWHPTAILLPGEYHGQGSLEGCSPWGRWGSDVTGWLHLHISLSCIGEGNGNPLQCSCLESPGDGEPSGLTSMGSHKVRHDWSELAATARKNYFSVWRSSTWNFGLLLPQAQTRIYDIDSHYSSLVTAEVGLLSLHNHTDTKWDWYLNIYKILTAVLHFL